MPLPDIAIKCGLGVHLVLMHIHRAIEQLHYRVDQSRMGTQSPERVIIGMRREGGARYAGFLAPDLFALLLINIASSLLKYICFFRVKCIGEKQVALFIVFVDLQLA